MMNQVLAQLETIILGKPSTLRLALTCLLAKGHLLLEDVPGVGKTTLAHALGLSLGLQYQRLQFTNDVLPSDILGVNVYDQGLAQFVFHRGPIFTQLLLADEINRASPKVQSALLEAMEERQVSIEGHTYKLTEPFFVIATQNPNDQRGTFTLPESQLDRFLMCLSLGYPDAEAELALLQGYNRQDLLANLQAKLSVQELLSLQQQVKEVGVSISLAKYVLRLLEQTRSGAYFVTGLSPRAGLSLVSAARAYAFLEGRSYVLPEDVQAIWLPVAAHRLSSVRSDMTVIESLGKIIGDVSII